jgi:hypothetical protein
MKNTFLLFFFFAFIACQNTKPSTDENPAIDSTNLSAERQEVEKAEIIEEPKDTTPDYSEEFLKSFENMKQNFGEMELKGEKILMGENGHTFFPEEPLKGKTYVLTAIQDQKLAISVTVKRINYSTIDYKVEIVEFGKAKHIEEGQAHLSAGFILGDESDESSLSGNYYGATEFFDNKENCSTSIRLGRDETSGNFLLGKLIKDCNGEIKDIELDNFPTLIEK